MSMTYNAPTQTNSGVTSDIGPQMATFFWYKKAIIDAQKEMYFGPLANTIAMPKNMGKQIKVLQYIPLLDDRNVNDQGIDAAGVAMLTTEWFVRVPQTPVVIANASKAAFVTALNASVGTDTVATAAADDSAVSGFANVNIVGPLTVKFATVGPKDTLMAFDFGGIAYKGNGNLYGSSRDIGTITGRLPTLTETGGRVNRVGFTRVERTAQLQKMGFFTEFSQESFDFDSDSDLYQHLSRELVTGATQLTEAILQIDLLLGAGTVVYCGAATSNATTSAEGTAAAAAIVDYDDMMRLATILNDNRTPKTTTVISGSRMIDTRVINSGRLMYIGSELESTIKRMVDPFNQPAFIPVQAYAEAGNVMNGEIGTIDQFRIIVVPEMLNWAGGGADVTTNPGYRATDDRYDVFPMLVVGDESFTTIGFQTDGKSVKFKITTKMPGEETADRDDPYGEMGFSSIKWYYSTLIMRPERLAMIRTVARI